MTRLISLIALVTLTACAGGDPEIGEDTDDANNDDPHVNSYVPDGYVPVDPTTAIFFGDSITAGVGAGPGLSWAELLVTNVDGTWADHAEEDFQSAFPSLTTTLNVAAGGARTGTISEQITAAEAGLSFPLSGPVVIGITIGGNDLVSVIFQPSTRAQVVADINANLSDFIDWTEDSSKFPDGAHVYLTNVYDPSDGVGTSPLCFQGFDTTEAVGALQDANIATRAMAEQRGFAVVDLHGHFAGHGLNNTMTDIAAYDAEDPSLWFESDCIHPNPRGHHELRRLMFGALVDEVLQHEIP